ncbi:TonB family protein [Aetokthonos hydrillicola Thurmond2011]|jgi:TonB family protein|uniref:TonB family protein n=1 Tax=Aetokthonos hydrillicola Thurmond2011 TaxID=2712845 RepID=A0AAP5I4P6_9CYAN|nr:energy transducer TonB [Aetokthonos hydrillicola]MBO3457428.1 TonB family protein [Aetokthonos hydrillicola CCALA 1050]MBW4586050.1 TonB family protein [Aetokthonos hydrillicola CCALA 1050]MDR9893724.1 TonB family protein [Aetokthonos hydrillicola Thurmond2011]
MSFSSKSIEHREQEQKVLRTFLFFSFISSVVLHTVVLTLFSFWFRTPKLEQQPIELILIDPPSLPPAKPKLKTKIKVPTDNDHKSDTRQSIKKIPAQKTGGFAPSSRSTASVVAIAPSPLVISKKPSQPNTYKQILTKPAKVVETPKLPPNPIATVPPKVVENPKSLPTPIATIPPKVVETPKLPPNPIATVPPKVVENPKPLLTPIATVPPKVVENPKPLPTPIATVPPKVAHTPKQVSTPTPKPTITSDLVAPIPSSSSSEITKNSIHQLDNPNGVSTRKNTALASGNTESNRTQGSRNSLKVATDSHHGNGSSSSLSNGGEGSGNSLKVATGSQHGDASSSSLSNGSEGSGNGSKVATGSQHGNGSRIRSGTSGAVCRRCPKPDYPRGSENLEGRAVVEIEIDKDGNVISVEIVKSTGHDNLDQAVLETVKKKWKFASSENKQRVRAAVNFAMTGSDFYHQARKREHETLKK